MVENYAPIEWICLALVLVSALLFTVLLVSDKSWCTPGRVLLAFAFGVLSVQLVEGWQWCRGIDYVSALLFLYCLAILILYATSADRGVGKILSGIKNNLEMIRKKMKRVRSRLRVVNDD